MGAQQIAVRLPEEVLDELDALVTRGVYGSRASAVRAGIEAVIARARREATDAAIVDGYRRVPPTDAEGSAAVASLRDAILEEPW
jgi:Arc/MetJ-type ribon-helix-helix transcriptional regulator